MKVKLLAVLVAVAAIFIGAVLWRTDSFVYGDRMNWVEAQTRTQLGSINHSLSVELKSLQRVVTTFNSENFQKGKINWNSLAPYYAAASFAVNGAELDPQVLLAKDNSKAANWSKEFVKSALGKIDDRSQDQRYFIKPFQDSNRGRYVAVVVLEGNRGYALFSSGEIFQSLIDAQRGSLSSFSIVTSGGLTVGHSIPEYLGTVMRDDPLFKEAKSSGASHGGGVVKANGDQEVYGMYEQVPQSNLMVISSAPLKEAMKGRSGLWWQFLLLGAGLILVGSAGMLFVINPAENQIQQLENDLLAAQKKAAAAPPVEKTVKVDPELAQKEKVSTSMRVASALAHEMRGPLASILGYSQMILAKSPESEIVDSTDSILRETRAAREILNKLLGYAGEEVKEKNSMKVEGPLARSLKSLEALFYNKGVKLTRNFQETSAMDLHSDALAKAFENILTNSVEAMERMPRKEIKLDLFEDEAGIHLNIEDNGEGIDVANLEKIFDPFFTTRSFQNHMGLGLSVAFGVLKEHGAEVKVTSERGKGTKVAITFKKSQAVQVMKAPIAPMPAPAEDVMVMSHELPSLKEDSVHHEEAAADFAEVQAEQSANPLDVNIDNLLELPELKEEKVMATDTTEEKKIPPPPTAKPSITPPPAGATLAPPDGLEFVDDFSDSKMPPPPPMDDELTPVNLINAPKEQAPVRTSKLDDYRVEIRRPGKRI